MSPTEVFEIALRTKQLPTKIEDLVPMVFIGNRAVRFYGEKIKMLKDLGVANEQLDATIKDGQEAGELVLDMKAKIGELCLKEPQMWPKQTKGATKVQGGRVVGVGSLPSGKPLKHERLGISNRNKMNQYQNLAKNPAVVAEIKAKARENDDIATETAVISEIRYRNEKKRRKEAEGKQATTRLQWAADQLSYIHALDRCAMILPKAPPKDWNEDAFREAKAKANILMKRLEVFNEQYQENPRKRHTGTLS